MILSLSTIIRKYWGRPNLDDIANKYHSDKGTRKPLTGNHGPRLNFTPVYGKYMEALRDREISILEIGVGSGASLKMWPEYFTKAKIYAIDVVDQKKHDTDRVKTFLGDQSDRAQLKAIMDQIGPVDIIVDDGSHVVSHQQITLATLLPYLKVGGQYWLEDLHTSDAAVWHGKTLYGYDMSFADGASTVQVLESFQKSRKFSSPFLDEKENAYLTENIGVCEMFTLPKTSWGINKLCLMQRKKPQN
jgi:hypothetical protein